MGLRPWAVVAVCGVLAGCAAAPAPTPEPEPSIPGSFVPLEPTPTPKPSPSPTAPPGMVFGKDGKTLLRAIPADPKRSFRCRTPKPAEAHMVEWTAYAPILKDRPFFAVDAGGGWAAVGFWRDPELGPPEAAFAITNGELLHFSGDGGFEGSFEYPRAGVVIEDAGRAQTAVARCVKG